MESESSGCLTPAEWEPVLRDDLAPRQRVRVAIHVAECPSCREQLRSQRQAHESAVPLPTMASGRSPRPARTSRAMAFALFLLGGLTITLAVLYLTALHELAEDRRRTALAERGRAAAEGELRDVRARLHGLGRELYGHQMRLAETAYRALESPTLKALLSACDPEHRAWEWQYFKWHSDRSERTCPLTRNPLLGAAFDARGRRLAIVESAEAAEDLLLWERNGTEWTATRERPAPAASLPGGATALALSRDGALAAAGSGEGEIQWWGVPSRALSGTLRGHSWSVLAIAFSTDLRYLVSGSADESVRLWDLEAGRELANLSARGGAVRAVASSADGAWFAAGGDDGTLRVGSWSERRFQRALGVSGHAVTAVAFAPAGEIVACGRADGTVELWRRADGKLDRTLRGHRGPVQCLAYDAVSGAWVSGGADATVRRWSPAADAFHVFRGHDAPVRAIATLPDGTLVSAAASGELKEWGAGVIPGFRVRSDAVTRLVALPHDRLLVGGNDGILARWNSATGDRDDPEPVPRVDGGGIPARILDVSRDGKRVLVREPDGVVMVREGGVRLVPVPGSVAALNPAGTSVWVAVGGELADFDVATGSLRRTLCADLELPTAIAVSDTGSHVACLSGGGLIRIWNLREGRECPTIAAPSGSVERWALGPRGERLMTASSMGPLYLWEIGRTQPWILARDPDLAPVMAFDPGGRRVAVGERDGGVEIRAVDEGDILLRLDGHAAPVTALGWSPDGRNLCSGDEAGAVRVWRGSAP